MSNPWWQRLPSRLLEEENHLLKLREGESPIAPSHRWVCGPEGELRLFVQIRVGSRTLELEVRFPAHYPEGCPSVRPVPHDTRISTHQFKRSGILCLELGPDNWHPRYTVADMIRSAWKLVAYETLKEFEPIEIPSRHVPSLAERVALASRVFLRSCEFEARMREAAGCTEFEVVLLGRHHMQILPVSFPKDSPLNLPPAMLREGDRLPGLLVRLQEGAPAPEEVPDDPVPFAAFVETFGKVSLEDRITAILLKWTSGETRGYLNSKSAILKLEDMPLEMGSATRLPEPLHSRLSNLKVGIVGLGSLGSKVAASLARAGLRRFVLVDGDVMQGENVCRHYGTYADVGVMKVEVAKQAIRDVLSIEPEVTAYAVCLGAPTNPELHARILDDLGTCEVLVDATANPEAFNLLASLASDHRHILVWAEVFGGGLGGLVASAHPERGPCPRCVRAGFLSATATWPPAPYDRPGAAYSAGEDTSLAATDADVNFIASAITNRINDLVIRDESLLPSAMLLGLRRGWIFEAPMQSIPVHIRSDDWSCDQCWRPAADPHPDAAASAEKLLEIHAHGHDPSHD